MSSMRTGFSFWSQVNEWKMRFYFMAENRHIVINDFDFFKLILYRLFCHGNMTNYFDIGLQDNKKYIKELLATRYHGEGFKYLADMYVPGCSLVDKFSWFLKYRIDRHLYKGLNACDFFRYDFEHISCNLKSTFITEGYLKSLDYMFNGGLDNNKEAILTVGIKSKFNTKFESFINRAWIDMRSNISFEEFSNKMDGLSRVILKPINGIQGLEVRIVDISSPDKLKQLYDTTVGTNYILEEVVIQHEALALLNNTSVNTIRVFSVHTGKEVVITDCALRMGRSGQVTDNYHAGGIACALDISTGLIVSRGVDRENRAFQVHPDSHVQFSDFKVPCWNDILSTVKNAHELIPELGFIGWDMAVLNNGGVSIIEANTIPGVTDLIQYPLLVGRKHEYDILLMERLHNLEHH